MAAKFNVARVFATLLLFALFTITSQLPGSADAIKGDILVPDAPAQAPSLWATPLELDFGPVGVGSPSDPQVVIITNTGDALLANFTGGNVPAPFHTANNCASGVLPGNSCQYSFWVEPASTGLFEATATISTNAGPFTVRMHAQSTSLNAALTASPLSLDFGTVQTSPPLADDIEAEPPQIVVVRNIGIIEISGFSGGDVLPPFTIANDCPLSLLPGEECQYFYNFIPTQEGSFSATSTVNTNAGSFSIKMVGKGQTSSSITGQRATPLELDFGPVGIGTPGDAQEVTLKNLSITSVITGFNISYLGAPFILSQNCTPNVGPDDFCTYTYNFAPLAPGSYITTSTTTNSAGTFTVTLRGTGVGPELSATPLVLDFGPVPAGTTSDPQMVTIKNTGQSMVTNIVTNDVPLPFSGSQNCANGLLPGETCQLTFYYSPTTGVYTDTTTAISANGISSGIEITLMGGVKPPQVSKKFIPDTIPAGGVSTLQLKILDPNPAATLFSVAITDTFPAGMVIATPLNFNLSPECGTPAFIPVAGKGSLSLADSTILGNKTCTIEVNVTAPLPKDYLNTTGIVKSKDGPGDVAKATLKVRIFNYIPYISK